LGLQDKFNWAAVAAAGVGAGVGQAVRGALGAKPLAGYGSARDLSNISKNMAASGVDAITQAATLSLVNGSDFGDNLRSSLPSVLGNLIGGAIGGALKARQDGRMVHNAQVGTSEVKAKGSEDSAGSAKPPSSNVLADSVEPVADVIIVSARRQQWSYQPLFLTIGTNSELQDKSKVEPRGPLGSFDDYLYGKPFNYKSGRTFLIGGAGNDPALEYLPLLKKSFTSAGIRGIEITDGSVSNGIGVDAGSIILTNQLHYPSDYARLSGKINLKIPEGGQLNFIGYSWGAVQAAQTSLTMAYSGYKVDNVVLLGAPINADLLTGLANHPNIGRVTVINLGEFGDPIYAGMPDYKIVSSVPTLIRQMNQGNGHFVYSQQGPIADARRDYLGKIIYQNGVR
jgi:hypothetical protein